jgi:uncharacterized protein YlxW (UPF0749 family)
MKIFNPRSASPAWIWPVSAMCVVLAFMFSLAWVTQDNRRSRVSFLSPDQSRRINEATVDVEAFQELQTEVEKLQKEKTKLENTIAGSGSQAKALNDLLQQSKVFAGLTELEGPGVLVLLRDSAKTAPGDFGGLNDAIVHDTDVLQVVNELFSAGAEAVSVNDLRVTNRVSFRCVGPTILVNDVKIASPIEIRAIGDPKTLLGAMNLPGGILAQFRQTDPSMVQLERVQRMTIKPFTGNTDFKFGKPPKANQPGTGKS